MRICLVFIHFFISFLAYTQVDLQFVNTSIDQKYRFINYTTEQGLPSNETFCIFEDSRGYIWIGTDRGLVKYDGYEFKTYTTLDGLTDNCILAINEDQQGRIWYTGLNGIALGYIDLNMKFHPYEYRDKLTQYFKKNVEEQLHFNEIFFDANNIILNNGRYGMISINKEGEIVQDLINRTSIIETHVIDVNSGVKIYSSRSKRNKTKINIHLNKKLIGEYNSNTHIFVNPSVLKNDSVYVIYDEYNKVLIKNDAIQHSPLERLTYAIQLSDDYLIYSVNTSHDQNGEVYLSSSVDFDDDKIKILNGPRIVNGILDRNNGLWLSSLRHGVFYFPSLNSKITENNDPIESILPLEDGLIYGTINKQYYINKKNYNINELMRPPSVNHFYNSTANINIANLISFDNNGSMNRHKGYYRVSDSLAFTKYGVHLYKHKLNHNQSTTDRLKLNIDKIQDMYCFKADSCLLSTTRGIYLYHKSKVDTLNSFPKKRINDIEFLERKNIFLFSIWGEGLHIFKDDSIYSLSENDGLFSNTINQFFIDENETIWICTNKGINTLSILDDDFVINKELGVSHILKSPNVLQLYVEDSMMYIGTDKGFNIFDLKSERHNLNDNFPLELTSIHINNILYKYDELKYLDYDENNLTFTFLGISPRQFANIKYKYRLKGLSDEWIYTTERRANFIKVEPGKYQFELQAENELGDWISLSKTPQIIINKPFWYTWWFIGGITLCILLIIGSFLYYYISNLQKEKMFVENEQLLSEELNESRQKALSAQLNPHFVFNSLNSIQNFILTKRTELSSDYLSTFSKLMRFVFENSKKLYVPLYDEIEALRLYLELEQVRHNHQFQYQIISNDLPTHDLYMPSLLVQPIIENAIWHGLLHKSDKDKMLEVHFSLDQEYLRIEVKDNGVGRGLSKPRPKLIRKQKSSGIELTKQRLNLLSQSTGLNTIFEIVDLKDQMNNPCGTSVVISIPSQL